jgi:hypothetical protein
MLRGNRRAASASARGPRPHSLTRSVSRTGPTVIPSEGSSGSSEPFARRSEVEACEQARPKLPIFQVQSMCSAAVGATTGPRRKSRASEMKCRASQLKSRASAVKPQVSEMTSRVSEAKSQASKVKSRASKVKSRALESEVLGLGSEA